MQGLRTQELIALKWKNVDFESREIRVREAVKRIAERDSAGNIISRGSKLGRLKTESSRRDIAMPQVLLGVLHEWREYCKLKGINTSNEDYVFPNTERGKQGSRRSYSSLRSMFRRFVAKHGLTDEGLTLYMFRHTFATMLLEEKVNPKIVSEMMGHSNIKTTLDIYSTVFKSVYAEAADTLNNAFRKISVKENQLQLAYSDR
jgi:integrase